MTKLRLTDRQRLLLRKARQGFIPYAFNESLKVRAEELKPEDWEDLALLVFFLAREKFGDPFGKLYAGYLLLSSAKNPRKEIGRFLRSYRAAVVRFDARRKAKA